MIYDYVIVGAGSAGCVVASRISENRNLRVALLDAGPDIHELSEEEQAWVSRPDLFQYMQDTRLDWRYWTEPQRELAGRCLFCPRGKIVGGTSTFIAGMYIRGNRDDYDEWDRLGNSGWRYENVLPYFKRLEHNLRSGVDPRVHSHDGVLAVNDLNVTSKATQTFLHVAEELGYQRNDDFNAAVQDGFGVYQFYLNERGTRVNSANGYLSPAVRSRSNLDIISNAHARELILERSNDALIAKGVHFVDRTGGGRKERMITATREVIVSCGAVDSPKLLMLSGIGAEYQLRQHRIRPRKLLRGVGENYQDHLVVPMGWLYKAGVREELIASGIDGGMFVRTDGSRKTPDLQFIFNHAILGPPGEISKIGFQIVPALVDPKSRGRVTLRSRDPSAPPLIDGGFLTNESDLRVLIEGVRRGLKIVGHSAFKEFRGSKLPAVPPPDFDASAEQIEAFIRQFSVTLFHPSGTCKMGPATDGMAVVDSELRVYGISGLRVVDASIMPTITTGNCHTPVTMIGEKASDMILKSSRSISSLTSVDLSTNRTFLPSNTAAELFSLNSALPPNVTPEIYQLDRTRQYIETAAYLPIFSVRNPRLINKPVFSPCSPMSPVAVEVNESLHRLAVGMSNSDSNGKLCAANDVGDELANVSIRWTVIPDDYEALPNSTPPPTSLNPFRSQRFAMMNGVFTFRDKSKSGFRGFGTGRTFPVNVEGKRQLRIGAVVNILEGFGSLRGIRGTVVVNGFIRPPQELMLSMIVRLMDPERRFHSTAKLSTLRQVEDSDSSATLMTFLGEVDPERPVKLLTTPDGQILGSMVYEKLRLVDLDFDANGPAGIQAEMRRGPIVGSLSAKLHFNPLAPTDASPISTTEGVFNFSDGLGNPTGMILANMVEGLAFKTEVPGGPFPIFRFGGFGPILGGTGHFKDINGMMSMNAAVSVFPRTLSNLYVFRIYDPTGRYRETRAKAWDSLKV